MKRPILLSAAITLVTCQLSPAQAPPASLPPSTAADLNSAAASAGEMQLRTLQAVLDARERRQDWHKAAQDAADRITDPALKDQFNHRLAGLVPIVAKALVGQPGQDALVTVAVYREQSQSAKQAMIAVTFNGPGQQISQGFFANVIAGMPELPVSNDIPKNLSLDTEATSYLVFFLGKDQLLAGDIPHTVMGRSVVAMLNKQRQSEQNATGKVAVVPNATLRQPTAPPPQPSPPLYDNNVAPNGYINPNAYPMINDGYYYPSNFGVPIVILPGESPSSPDALTRQRQRQIDLERRYQNSPYGVTPQAGNSNTPQSGNYVTPQSGNYVTPQSGNNVNPGAGNNVNPQQGNRPSGPKQFPKAGEPGGPPAGKAAPQQPATGTPPAGAPGGPPANKDHPQQPPTGTPPAGAPGGPPAQNGKK